MDSFLEDRRRALEESFFAKKNKELMSKLKEHLNVEKYREELKQATGIDDDAVLDRILESGVNVESLAALSIAPLVLVAWADGKIDSRERAAVISGAEQAGIKADSPGHALLSNWLSERPASSLVTTWTEYTRALCARLTPGDQVKLQEKILGRCKHVAEAAGGFLGLGSISKSEHAMLNQLETAFEPQV